MLAYGALQAVSGVYQYNHWRSLISAVDHGFFFLANGKYYQDQKTDYPTLASGG